MQKKFSPNKPKNNEQLENPMENAIKNNTKDDIQT